MPEPRWELDGPALAVDAYPLLNSVVVPRPVTWIATRSAGGVDNVAPFSWVTVASTRPPVVCFTSSAGTDTLANCRHSGEFVLCVPPEWLLDAVLATAVAHGPGVSEFDLAGLTREPAAVVAAARVAESPLALECRVVDERCFGTGSDGSVVVFGEVAHLAADHGVLLDALPDVERLRPLSRLNRDLWGALGPLRAVPSPAPAVAPATLRAGDPGVTRTGAAPVSGSPPPPSPGAPSSAR